MRVESAEWGCTKAVGTAMCRGVYSCVRDSGNAWVPLDELSLLCMHVQSSQHGYIVYK